MAAEKAYLCVLDDCGKDGLNLKKDDKLYVQFNPEKYSISTTSQYSFSQKEGKLYGQYGGVESRTLNVEFFYDMLSDTNVYKNSVPPEAVNAHNSAPFGRTLSDAEAVNDAYVNKIIALTRASTAKSAPPRIRFVWGNESLEGVIISLTLQYVMFNQKGEPIRAHVQLSLKECDDVQLAEKSGKLKQLSSKPAGLNKGFSDYDEDVHNAEVKEALIQAIRLI